MSARAAFIRDPEIALLLDVDGTLLEIAATPELVRVPASLRNSLQLACDRQHGAVALFSGRSLAEVDQLFSPCILPTSARHGAEIRLPGGEVIPRKIDPERLDHARRWLGLMQRENRGLLLEDKGISLAMHFRLAPGLEKEVNLLMSEIATELGDAFVVRRGKCVNELMPRGLGHRAAIESFMRQREFAGRTPVFVGDDDFDEEAFEVVNAMGGHSIRVGDLATTAAKYRFSHVSTVIAWLRDRNLNR